MILKQFHRIIRFEQSPWLKPYIDLNTELGDKTNSEKDLYKLMNKLVFGNNCGEYTQEGRWSTGKH